MNVDKTDGKQIELPRGGEAVKMDFYLLSLFAVYVSFQLNLLFEATELVVPETSS